MTESINSLIERGRHLSAAKQIVDTIQESDISMILKIKLVKEALDAARDAGVDSVWDAASEVME